MKYPKRNDIYWVNLDPTVGSEIQKTRPAIIISNNTGNQYSQRVIVAPITSQTKNIFPFESPIVVNNKKGKVLLDQICAIDKKRLGTYISSATREEIENVNIALKVVVALK